MSVSKDFLSNTLVSKDYPNFVDSESTKKRLATIANISASNKETPLSTTTQQQEQLSLLDLVISVYSTIANLNIDQIMNRPFTQKEMDLLNATSSFSDMDTIDYAVFPGHLNNQHHLHGSSIVGGGENMVDGSITTTASANVTATSGINNNNMSSLLSSNIRSSTLTKMMSTDSRSSDANTVKRAAQLIKMHFINFMGHFPISKLRTSSLCALINETDDNPFCSNQLMTQQQDMTSTSKLELDVFNSPNVLVFIVGGTSIISFIELSPDSIDSVILSKLSSSSTSNSNNNFLNIQSQRPIRIIIRNILGKFSWNCLALQVPLLPNNSSMVNLFSGLKRPEPVIKSIVTSNGHYQRLESKEKSLYS